MKTVVVTSATGEPITLEDVKSQLRLELGQTNEDEFLEGLITAARQHVENITGRKLMPQTWTVYYDAWPSGKDNYDTIEIPYPPLRSIPSTGLVYTDSTSGSTTLSSTAWAADTVSEPGRLVLDYNDDWPTVTLHNNNPIAIEFNCGYSTAATIPGTIKQAVKMLIGHYYENRESVTGTPSGMKIEETPWAVKTLLAPYREYRF
jgi:uncharacterized phiE125 gp8 family phage protein